MERAKMAQDALSPSVENSGAAQDSCPGIAQAKQAEKAKAAELKSHKNDNMRMKEGRHTISKDSVLDYCVVS